MNGEVLNSWKEIADYMGRGVRTVQRWEQELGLPVRRPRGKNRSAVLALKPDLDHWLKSTPHGMDTGRQINGHERRTTIHLSTEELLKRTQEILERSVRMNEAVKTTLALTIRLRDQQVEARRQRPPRRHAITAMELIPEKIACTMLEDSGDTRTHARGNAAG